LYHKSLSEEKELTNSTTIRSKPDRAVADYKKQVLQLLEYSHVLHNLQRGV